MKKIIINGQKELSGTIYISGSKNAALPLLACTLLSSNPMTLKNVPNLTDVDTLLTLLQEHGTNVITKKEKDKSLTITLDSNKIINTTASYELVKKMRASILVLGPLLAKHKHAKVSLPGGCAIGTRPIDLHLDAFKKMGAEINISGGYVIAKTKNTLQAINHEFPLISVGATENVVMAATLAQGKTTLHRVAKEPEIIDLANCLNAMGAKISGAGTDTITIEGVKELHSTEHHVLADRIEAASFACIGALSQKPITILNINTSILEYPLNILKRAGAKIHYHDNGFTISGGNLHGIDITTAPYPEFPTDLQAQFMATFTISNGSAIINENIFENRFMHVPELLRLGANLKIQNNTVVVHGKKELTGAEVMATDLRASMSLIIAGLFAKGKTTINRIYHLDRGYSHLEEKLKSIGADIRRA